MLEQWKGQGWVMLGKGWCCECWHLHWILPWPDLFWEVFWGMFLSLSYGVWCLFGWNRLGCWQKLLEVGSVATRIWLSFFIELGGHRILKYKGVARWCWFWLEHNPHPTPPAKIRGEFWKSQISQWLAYLSGYSHDDRGTKGIMSGGHVMSIYRMRANLSWDRI